MVNDSPLRRKLVYVASRRSMAEMEVVLGRFLKAKRADLDDVACERLLTLLQFPDAELYDWLSGILTIPPEVDQEVLFWLSDYRCATPSS